jgi:isoquinoline 1-oxidoreductase
MKTSAAKDTHQGVRKADRSATRQGHSRREFLGILGAGILICVALPVPAQQGTGRSRVTRARTLAARIHLGKDGAITVLTGKVEGGQGARAELTQAAAEELRVLPERINLIMADTSLVPDDGITAGSRSTPSTVPAIRQAAATVRQLLIDFARKEWSLESGGLEVADGRVTRHSDGKTLSYADLASNEASTKILDQPVAEGVTLTPVKEFRVFGKPFARPNARDIVTGAHKYPSDIERPGMLFGKVLRPPSWGARLVSIDLAPAKAMKDVVAVQDDNFAGVAAPTTHQARAALLAIAKTAKWEETKSVSNQRLFDHLRENARGGIPQNPYGAELAAAKKTLKQSYHVAYAQHAPLEPRAAVAEWADGKLTVWTGTQNPFGCRSELARAFGRADTDVRVIVPDFGSGFGGKHTGEAGVEAARLAKAAGKPVSLRWTREEEFTWAYFRPAALIEIEASLDDKGALTSWHFLNINSGGAAVDTPYRAGKAQSRFIPSNSPLRIGSYRALASTANNFARECFMDELAAEANQNPLEFRLAHLENERLRAVLETAAKRFGWQERYASKKPGMGVGLACGTEKGSVVAACVEIEIDSKTKAIAVRHVCEVFECGPVLNPVNLRSQVHGCIIMGLGPALREEARFEDGKMLNASFRRYRVPRFDDVPDLDIHFLDRADLPAVGSGETPIIAVAPAIANAVFHATGSRVREMPIRPT